MSPYAPLSAQARATLRRYRLLARESVEPNPTGGQLMRRKGQSLEFREHLPYLPGDDIRFVDWRASARYGTQHDLLVRSFVAEERMRLLVSIDPRATMRLPQALPKLQHALWLAEALMASGGPDDELLLHWLFDVRPSAPARLHKLEQLYDPGAAPGALNEDAPANLQQLRPCLPPTAIWLVVTDLYFDDSSAARALAATMADAQARMCWVLLVELDSWPYEQALMGEEVWRLERPGGDRQPQPVQLTPENLREVAGRIARHRERFLDQTQLANEDRLSWAWPSAVPPAPEDAFLQRFTTDSRIKALFFRQHV
jgi:hypothetical protein